MQYQDELESKFCSAFRESKLMLSHCIRNEEGNVNAVCIYVLFSTFPVPSEVVCTSQTVKIG